MSTEHRAQSTEHRAQSTEHRVYYLDYLRVFATLLVVFIHVSAQKWYTTDIKTFEWNVINFYHSGIVRCAVPCFVMISGALFLHKDIPLSKIYGKYIFRIFTAFLFWSVIYASPSFLKHRDVVKMLAKVVRGHYHLWFLFMITGLYMIIPFMKKIAESESLTRYFLILAFVVTFFVPQSANLIALFSEKHAAFIREIIGKFRLDFIAGFTGYFLLGYVLNRVNLTRKQAYIIYFIGVLGFFATIIMSVSASYFTNKAHHAFYDNLSVNVLCESAAVFVFFKRNFSRPSRIILTLSKYTFGAYLVHDALIQVVRYCGLNPLSFNPVFSVPVIAVIVFVFAFMISGILNHVPVLKSYVV